MGMEGPQGDRWHRGQVPVPALRRKARGHCDPSRCRAELAVPRHKFLLSSRPSERRAGTHIAEPVFMGPGSVPRLARRKTRVNALMAWLGRDDSGEVLYLTW